MQYHKTFLLFAILLTACTSPYTYVAKTDYSSTGVSQEITADTAIENMIIPYRAKLDAEMNEVIGEAAEDIPKRVETPEHPLGKAFTDLLLAEAQSNSDTPVHLALLNTGGLRVPISKGPISVGLIFELMPFENEVVIVKLTGKELKQLFSKNTQNKVWPISNTVLTYRRGVFVEGEIGGQAYDENKEYYLATSDYLAKGGDNMAFLIGKPVTYSGIKVRDAFIHQIKELTKEGKKLRIPQDKRAIFEGN